MFKSLTCSFKGFPALMAGSSHLPVTLAPSSGHLRHTQMWKTDTYIYTDKINCKNRKHYFLLSLTASLHGISTFKIVPCFCLIKKKEIIAKWSSY